MKITRAVNSTGILSSLILCFSLTRCIGLEHGFSHGLSRRLRISRELFRLPSSFNDFVNGFSQTPEEFYSENEDTDFFEEDNTNFYEDLSNMNGDQYGTNHNPGEFYGGGGQRPNGGYGGRPEGFGSSRPSRHSDNFEGDEYSENDKSIASVTILAEGSGSTSAGSGTNHRPQYGGWREGDAQSISASPSLLSYSFVGVCMIASVLFLS